MPRGRKFQDPLVRFWSKVNKKGVDGCWEWQGCLGHKDYGVFWNEGKNVYAHRFAYSLEGAVRLSPDIFVLHECDNPRCVNFRHLFLGDHVDNMTDMVEKGRAKRFALQGSDRPNSQLNESQVTAILRLYPTIGNYAEIGRRFGVSYSVVSEVVRGISYRHVRRPHL